VQEEQCTRLVGVGARFVGKSGRFVGNRMTFWRGSGRIEPEETTMKHFAILMGAVALLGAETARFDHKVRDLFFAGFAGDKESMAKAMTLSEATLKENPDHAEALVWAGSGIFFQSTEKFRTGDMAAGMALFQKGTGMMDRGAALEPKSIGVRIPRGSA
jgi:hypothetical protein